MSWNEIRKAYLTEENIAREAYIIWENRGRPFGDEEHHWFSAIERLEMAAEMDAENLSPAGVSVFCDTTCCCECDC